MTSSSASDHGNPAGVAVSMQKGTISKGVEMNRNFGKWLSYFREFRELFCSTSYSCHICCENSALPRKLRENDIIYKAS